MSVSHAAPVASQPASPLFPDPATAANKARVAAAAKSERAGQQRQAELQKDIQNGAARQRAVSQNKPPAHRGRNLDIRA